MMILPPVAGANAGQSVGGGLLDNFKNAVAAASGGGTGQPVTQTDPGPKGDGSVGLFDGVLKKALFGGAAGAAMGFIPFLPGGPVLGGIVGALGGAAMGMFSNWTKMKSIQQDNQATIAAMGVQVDNPEIQQVLQSGNVSQLIPMMQSAQQGDPSVVQQGTPTVVQQQQGGTYQVTQEELLAQQAAIQQGQVPVVVDPGTSGIAQTPLATQGTIAVGSGAGTAINPSGAIDPGAVPSAYRGGGGSAGDAGRPPAPVGVEASSVSEIAPQQPGIPASGASDAAQGADLAVSVDDEKFAQLKAILDQLQRQIDLLRETLEARDQAAA